VQRSCLSICDQIEIRAALQAQLLQQGFGQAQQLAAQQYQQQMGFSISKLLDYWDNKLQAYSTLGAQQQAQEQARLQAQQNLAYQQAYQPLQAAQTLGQGVMGLICWLSRSNSEHRIDSITKCITNWIKSAASTLAGIYRAFNPPAPQPIQLTYPKP
jgi:hypothetical protein